jgi:tight adherence protein B
MILPLAVFGAVLALILGVYFAFVVRPEADREAKLHKRLKAGDPHARAKQLGILKEVERLSSVDTLNTLLLRGNRFVAPARRLVEQSGKKMTVGTFLLSIGCAALIPWFFVSLITGRNVAGIVAAAVCAPLPYLWLKRARYTRLLKFEEQFPEAIDLIGRALRAGHTLQTGLAMVADEMPAPIGEEFKMIYDRQNFGMPLPEALRDFAERAPILDAKFFTTAVLTQREAGGNLAEVLDNLAAVIRERFKVKRQIRVLSAHGRITGWVLAGLPPALAVVFFIVSSKHMQTLLNDPLGVQLLIVAVVLQALGSLIIKKIINIEY